MLFLLSFLACTPTYDNFPSKLAAVVCDRIKECALGAFDATYDDASECQDELMDRYETYLDEIDDDDFDEADASDCIAELQSRDCEDIVTEEFPSECRQAGAYGYYY